MTPPCPTGPAWWRLRADAPRPLIRRTDQQHHQPPGTIRSPGGFVVEIDLDLWPLVAPLVPLLEEVERVEALAAGKTAAASPDANGQEETDHPGKKR